MKLFALALSLTLSFAAASSVHAAPATADTDSTTSSAQTVLERPASAPRATCEHYRRNGSASALTQAACRRADAARAASKARRS